MYNLYLTEEDFNTISLAGYRYNWSSALLSLCYVGQNNLEEDESWELIDAFESDCEDGHSPFPLLDPYSELCEKLQSFWDSVI